MSSTFYVSGDAKATPTGSQAAPFKTIQSAINAAKAGDTIYVAAGTYKENISVSNKSLQIISLEGAEKTKIISASAASVARYSGAGVDGGSLNGFTLSGGAGYTGAYNQYGGGIDVSLPADKSITVRNCIVSDNKSAAITFGGGMHISGGGTANVINTLFRNNAAWANGGAILVEGSKLVMDACTVVGNRSDYYNEIGGVSAAGNCDVQIKNSILWGNSGSQYGSFTSGPSGTGKFTFENSAVSGGVNVTSLWGNTRTQSFSTGTNYTQDPVFSGAADYSLSPESPYKNAGSVSAQSDPDGSVAALGYRTIRQSVGSSSVSSQTVTSSVTYPLQSGELHLILTGTAHIDGTGNSLDNSLTGNSGSNLLDGQAGNDTITGGGGNDTLVGGSGNDLLVVGGQTGRNMYLNLERDKSQFLEAEKPYIPQSGPFTVSVKAKWEGAAPGDFVEIISQGYSGNSGFYIGLDGSGGIRVGDSWNNRNSTAARMPQDGLWHCYQVVVSGNNASLFVDGVESATTQQFRNPLPGTNTRIGAQFQSYGEFWNGSIADVEIYGTALSKDSLDAVRLGRSLSSDSKPLFNLDFSSGVSAKTPDGTINLTPRGSIAPTIEQDTMGLSSASNTSLSGGAGNDTLLGGEGNDTLSGGDGNDLITAGSGTGGSTYQIVQGNFTWDQAKADAEAKGGHLATFTSQQEWETYLNTQAGRSVLNYRIGLEAPDTRSNEWKWATEESVGFTNWDLSASQPDRGIRNNEDSVVVYGGRNGVWHDYSKDIASFPYLLEIESPSAGNNSLSGGEGSDTLTGSAASDTLDGGSDNDSMLGCAGDDLYLVDSAADVVAENSAEGTDTVSSSIAYTLGENLENLVLTGAAAINATGNTLNNSLIGNESANQLAGGAGNDTLSGGAGNDTYVLESAGDLIIEAANAGTDTVRSPVSYTLGANLENLVLTGAASNKATGNSLPNAITGNAAANAINSAAGNDTISGGAGNDSLNAGTGIDVVKGEAGSDLLQIDWTSLPTYTVTKTVRKDGTGASASFSGIYTAKNTAGAVLSSVTFDGIESLSLNGQAVDLENAVSSPGVAISRTSEAVATTEQGGKVQYAVALKKAPVENVTLKFTCIDATEGKVLTPALTFTPQNWSTPQDLTIQGVDDYVDDGNIAYSIVGQIVTADLTYNRITVPTVNLINTDDGLDNDRSIYGTDETDYLAGKNGNDRIYGKGGQDDLKGGVGNDRLYGQEDNDRLYGEDGNDQLYGGYDDDTLDGGAGNDSLFGEQSNDTLLGGEGNDYIDGGIENDSMIGGAGNDTYVIDSAGDVINDLGASTDVDTVMVIQTITYTLPANIENASINATGNGGLVGNALGNNLTGNDGGNVLDGGTGSDTLHGGIGADSLLGGVGGDVLEGGAGNDTLRGGDGVDLADFQAAGLDVTVDLAAGRAGASDGNDWLFDIENVLGGVGSDTISGSLSDNDLDGGLGNDSLSGGSGNDSISGGLGNDTLLGGAGLDAADFTSSLVNLNVNLTTGKASGEGTDMLAEIENILAGTGNDTLQGSAAANNLSGGAGRDTLGGGDGNDTLSGCNYGASGGRGEVDTLTGGAGADVFALGYASGAFYDDNNAATTGTADYALVADFTLGTDRLQLDGLASGYYLAASGLSSVAGVGLWAERGKTDELIAIIRSANSTVPTTANTLANAVFV